MIEDGPLDITKLRYALYARKSTEDEGRQIRSISDQIKDCEKLASELGIKVIKPYIEETKSAKVPNQRLKFNQLIEDIEKKKYDGILCWHPDRLARNMMEAGRVIDMLDNAVIKDLRFVSHQFSNDANGKMLLGMLFVFSKHYSDDLSNKVNRGVKGNFSEGKSSGSPKHGYVRDPINGLYSPHPKFFEIIQKTWDMRASGIEIREIVDYLDENGYKKETKNGRLISASIQSISRMFQDPFYYGLLVQAGQSVDLKEISNFEPMITEVIYDKVQNVGYRKARGGYRVKKRAVFYPLRQFVVCSFCKRNMYVGKSQPRDKTALPKLYYRCDNKQCPRVINHIKRNVRAKVLFKWVEDFLSIEFKAISDQYDRYSNVIDSQSDTQRIRIKTQIQSKQGVLNHLESELNIKVIAISKLNNKSVAFKTISKNVATLEESILDVEASISKLRDKLTDKTKLKLSKDQFLNLIKNASSTLKAGDVVQKDRIIRIIFLNLELDGDGVVNYLCNEPFASMLKLSQISNGRGDRT